MALRTEDFRILLRLCVWVIGSVWRAQRILSRQFLVWRSTVAALALGKHSAHGRVWKETRFTKTQSDESASGWRLSREKMCQPKFHSLRLACCLLIGFHCLQFTWRGVLCSDTWISGVSKRNWISEYFQNEPTLLDYYQINCVSFEEGNTRLAKSYLQYRHNLRPSLSSLMRGQLETCSN